jgi:hypothetical protein
MSTVRVLGPGGLVALIGLAVLGCGGTSEEPTFPVRGKILKGSLPFSPQSMIKGPLPPGDPGAKIVFKRMGGSRAGEEFHGSIDPNTGDFEVPGNTGKGIPESRYQVTLYVGAFGVTEEKPSGRSGPPGSAPPIGGESSGGGLSLGKPVFQDEIEIPAGGKTDIVLEIDKKKK